MQMSSDDVMSVLKTTVEYIRSYRTVHTFLTISKMVPMRRERKQVKKKYNLSLVEITGSKFSKKVGQG